MMNKILITGATGFIGKNLVNRLMGEFKVRILVRNTERKYNFSDEIEWIKGDLTDPASLLKICEDIDTVFHLAGFAHAASDGTESFVQQHFDTNFIGTKNILKEALRSKVKRFVFFSSVKAVADTQQLVDESWVEQPSTPYGIAKRSAEKIVLDAKEQGMHVCVLRPSLVYGPNWKGNLDSMFRAIDKGFFLPLPDTNNKRSMISINDICNAAVLAAENPNANGKIYFVTDGIYYSTRQLYDLIKESLGQSSSKWHIPLCAFKALAWLGDSVEKIVRRKLPFDSGVLDKLFGSAQYNSLLIQQELGFKPGDNFKTLLPAIVASYRR